METKETPAIVMQEKVKADFRKWYVAREHNFNVSWWAFEDLPFNFRSGVYTAYLRDRGIYLWACPISSLHTPALSWGWAIAGYDVGTNYTDHDTALISAINEGFRIVEEQLKDKP